MERATRGDSNLVNLSEASRRLGINYVTLWRWIKERKVTPVRILGLPYLTLDQIESLKNKKNNRAAGRPRDAQGRFSKKGETNEQAAKA